MREAYATFGLLTGAFELIMNYHEKYRFYHSTLFDLPFVLGLFVLSVFFILLLGVALLDDLFHQTCHGGITR